MIQQNNDQILRFTRLDGSAEDNLKAERAFLEEEAYEAIASRRQSGLKLGRIFLRLKATCKHGEWKQYYLNHFSSDVPYRSAVRYMKHARKADADSKKDRLALLKPGTDPEKDDATEEALLEVGDGARPTRKERREYRLSLHLDAVRREATIRLWGSPRRRRAEKKMIAHLDEILVEFGALDEDALGGDHEIVLARA